MGSYVKFLNSEDIVSASTDSQLKLWNINQTHCARSFTGHVNEKNFVGLATDGDYVTWIREQWTLCLLQGALEASFPVQVRRGPLIPGPRSQGGRRERVRLRRLLEGKQ